MLKNKICNISAQNMKTISVAHVVVKLTCKDWAPRKTT